MWLTNSLFTLSYKTFTILKPALKLYKDQSYPMCSWSFTGMHRVAKYLICPRYLFPAYVKQGDIPPCFSHILQTRFLFSFSTYLVPHFFYTLYTLNIYVFTYWLYLFHLYPNTGFSHIFKPSFISTIAHFLHTFLTFWSF